MTQGFTISELRFRGTDLQDALVTFEPGLSVISGPSNTGKSLIRAAINFVFGSSDPMRTAEEAAGFDTIFVQIRTADGTPITFERSWRGGDIRKYMAPASEITTTTPSEILAAKHSADNPANVSAVLLSLAGLSGVRLRKNQSGVLRNLSFRDFVEYILISEERIITESSPIHTGSFTDKTFESSLFRALLTGQDDAGLIAAPTPHDIRANLAGQEKAIEQIRADIVSRIPQDGRTEDDLNQILQKLDASISGQSRLLQNYRTDLAELEEQRREFERLHRESLARHTQVGVNLKRFALLDLQYASDLERLQSTVEAGNLFGDHKEGPCPICGADPQYHQHLGVTPEDLDNFTAACQAEAMKIQARRTDLADTIATLETEHDALQTALTEIAGQRTSNSQAFKDILGPSITDANGSLADLSEKRGEIAATLALYDQLHRLDAIEQRAQPASTAKPKKDTSLASIPPSAYDEFAVAVQELLRCWSFPELDRVVYDTNVEDIVISGKARKDNGKGYRAITYAAFMIGVLLEMKRKHLPHPGFVLLDSPLVTYREPDEHIGEGVKHAFYQNLASNLGEAQVIVLENEEPSVELNDNIALTTFTKNRSVGRYGLFPALPIDEGQ
jgi:hypothetical protein